MLSVSGWFMAVARESGAASQEPAPSLGFLRMTAPILGEPFTGIDYYALPCCQAEAAISEAKSR